MPLRACLFLLLFSTILTHRVSARQAHVTGTVTRADTAGPVPGAHVFLTGTRLGDVTRDDGSFDIADVPSGTHELVVSHVGYETEARSVRITTTDAFELTVVLTPRSLGEIEVVAETPRARRRNLARFEKYFLGVSLFADDCVILNPEVLRFEVNPRSGVFSASATEPLLIENMALGYELRFVLDEFRLHEDRRAVQYSGKPSFRELDARDDRQARAWQRNRERAYLGSRRHFLTALAADRLHEEGFMLLEESMQGGSGFRGVPGGRPGNRVRGVSPHQILVAGELPFERKLSFPGFLKVLYFREVPDGPYEQFREFMDRGLRADEDAQVSWISLTQPNVTFTTDGILQESFAMTRFGYWFFERVAELLPADYRPSGARDPRAPPGEAPMVDAAELERLLTQGRALIEQGDRQAGIADLLRVHRDNPGYQGGELGHVLGLAYQAEQKADSAAWVWVRTLAALIDQEQFHIPTADALTRNIFVRQDVDLYEVGSDAFLRLLEHMDLAAEHRQLALRHVAQSLLLWSPADADTLHTRPPGNLNRRFEVARGTGEVLAAWWRAQDPLPATTLNERLAEHLARVAHAEDNYRFRGDLLGFDDRGKAYVRFGAPDNSVRVPVNVNRALQVLRENSYALPGPVVPPTNEVWTFRHVDDLVYHVFVLRGGRFQEGSAEDLVPEALQTAYRRVGEGHSNVRTIANPTGNNMPANQALAEALYNVWQGLYTTLAAVHPDFESHLLELESYESDVRATQLGGGTLSASSLSFVTAAQTRFREMAREAQARREEDAPRTYSRVASAIERFEVFPRYARFLDEDGSTRTEVFWNHLPGTLTPGRRQLRRALEEDEQPPERYLMDLVATVQNAGHSRREATPVSYLAADMDSLDLRATQVLDITGSREPFAVAMQWDQFLPLESPDGPERREYLRTAVHEFGLLDPLSADPASLEMSDLKPVVALDALFSGDGLATPYAGPSLMAGVPIGLVFEVYHLRFGDDDQTRYTTEVIVTRDPDGRRQQSTSSSSEGTGSSSRASELLAVDLGDLRGASEVEIRVVITDVVSGQRRERAVRFGVQ
ncbi:MAG: carboxypeptidase-like regulatory domain-containing protein [Rhodothermales bacterium]|nr:carboxypeptidase-like regulatory domain-containing protein [Rhodothermales bacterium]MBO6780904.1 carboxypeptidase-like regulatory domain-containing protein [Rhodothermales bacterium]